ncbi:MAG: hypothetical protein JXB49_13685 [Bacteroidales bacterium]|nr:hypothetical protein [Bacteroidales bacterium]
MNSAEKEKLRYRRQYLLVPEEIECPFLHNYHKIGNLYSLYSQIDLKVTSYSANEVTLVLLGDILDYEFPSKDNMEVLKDLISNDFEHITKKIANYSGRYVIIHMTGDIIILLNDATATRKIFFSQKRSKLWFASQPQLLAKILELKITTNKSKLAFYNSEEFIRLHNSNIGNTTIYDEIVQLVPNHYIDVRNQRIVRYWPSQKIERLPLAEVADRCAAIIKGYMESIALRYEIMLPLTAGKDSRLLLSATKGVKERVYFYTNRIVENDDKHPDIYIPSKLLSTLKLRHNLLDTNRAVDPDFIKVYFENNPYANKSYLPIIYNYYVNFANKVNLPGNFASGGIEHYKCSNIKVSAEKLAYLNGVDKYSFAVDYYNGWLSGCSEVCIKNKINILDLFYWEERIGNWGTQIQLEKDIAQEEVNIYNSRLLISLFLSVDSKFIIPPRSVLQKKIINHLWPEVLKKPINPSLKNKIIIVLQHIGIYRLLIKIKCILDRRKSHLGT